MKFPYWRSEILRKEDGAYIRLAPLPPYPLKVTEYGDHLMIHIDDKKNKVIGFTILHLSAFLKELEEKQHLKERAKGLPKNKFDYLESQI